MPRFNPNLHHRRSIRLRDWDYSRPAAYFVTICALQKECLFGEIVDSEMRANEYGRIAAMRWNEIPHRFPNAALDAFVLMPNHLHGIVIVGAGFPRPSSTPTPGAGGNQGAETAPLQPRLGQILGYFKYVSTKQINLLRKMPGVPVWQRNYYEHIIRSEDELRRVREYIEQNPAKWPEDEENPSFTKR